MNTRRAALGLALLAVGLTAANAGLTLLRFSIQMGRDVAEGMPLPLLRMAGQERLFWPVFYSLLAATAVCGVGALTLAILDSSRSRQRR